MNDHKSFAAFILTHGRPNQILTWRALKASGYTGAIYLILDSEDKTADEYRRIFGDQAVVQFDKADIAKRFDEADITNQHNTVMYARNASYEIAAELGLEYFVQLDDDYTSFCYRWVEDEMIRSKSIKNMDEVIEATLTFLDTSKADTVAWSQGGDHIGGIGGNIDKGLLRKAMNSYFCRTDNPIHFPGRINDDVNAYVVHGERGTLFFTIMGVQLSQPATQSQSGGMTDIYANDGTYAKSFYTVMMRPDCVKVGTIGPVSKRLHHRIEWDNAVPKILSEKYRTQSVTNGH